MEQLACQIEEKFEIMSNKCAAHTVSLACDKDMMEHTDRLFLKVNSFCIALRKSSHRLEFKQQNMPLPPLYCLKRWLKRFLMVEYINKNASELKIFHLDHNFHYLEPQDWL